LPLPTLFPYTTLFRSQRRVQVVDVDLVLHDVKPQFVGFTHLEAAFESAAGHPHRKRLGMMIPAHLATGLRVAFHHGSAAKFTARSEEHTSELQSQSNL